VSLWQARAPSAGMGYGIGPATLFIGYRYFATTRPELDGTKFALETHNLEARVRYGF
jgi:predicted porin